MHKGLKGKLEEQWEQAAFRWVLGLGACAGAWWALFGLWAFNALTAAEYSVAAPILLVALLPNILWCATKHDERVSTWLGVLRAVWRAQRRRPVVRSAKVALFTGAALWTALAA